MQRKGNSLEPVDDNGLDAILKYKEGQYVFVSLKTSRNYEFHKMYWAMMRFAYDNLPERASAIKSPEQLHMVLKQELAKQGYKIAGEFIMLKQPVFIPASTDFTSMSQEEFEEFYNLAVFELSKWLGFDVEQEFVRSGF